MKVQAHEAPNYWGTVDLRRDKAGLKLVNISLDLIQMKWNIFQVTKVQPKLRLDEATTTGEKIFAPLSDSAATKRLVVRLIPNI